MHRLVATSGYWETKVRVKYGLNVFYPNFWSDMYIQRQLEPLLKSVAHEYSAVLLTGPRQVGKSTLMEHVIDESNLRVSKVTLDDIDARNLAKTDSKLFFQLYNPPVLIDEIQYAPELFSQIKIMVDAGAPAGSFWMTGSQQFRLMELAGESLAGRVALLPLSSLSLDEEEGVDVLDEAPIGFTFDYWRNRESRAPKSILDMFEVIYRGAMPRIVSGEASNLNIFYSSYLQTFIERDVRNISGSIDVVMYSEFMRSVAARCSQLLNVASISRDIDARPDKVKEWLSILERAGIIFYLHPYSNNQLSRTVKAPKLYFHDCGLVSYLTRWSSAETLASGAMSGAMFENFVVSEIYKSFLNRGMDPAVYYYRDFDSREIDLVVEADGELHPIEIKRSASPNASMARTFRVLDKASVPRGVGAIVCNADKLGAIDEKTLTVPAWML
jgi:hypothetical protein